MKVTFPGWLGWFEENKVSSIENCFMEIKDVYAEKLLWPSIYMEEDGYDSDDDLERIWHYSDAKSYLEEYLEKNDVKKLRNKINIINNAKMSSSFPNEYSVSMQINFNNGFKAEITNKHAKGDPENPMLEQEIFNKTLNLLKNNDIDMHKAENLLDNILRTNISKDKRSSKILWFDDLQKIISN